MAKGNFSKQKGGGNRRRLRRLQQGKNTEQVKTSVNITNSTSCEFHKSYLMTEVKPSDEVPKVQETLKNTDILQVGGQRDLNRNEVPTLHLQL